MLSPALHSKQLIAAVLAVLWMATPLSALFHSRHVHRYCPEHQSLEEAGSVSNRQAQDETAVVEVAAAAVASAYSHQQCQWAVCETRAVRVGNFSEVSFRVPDAGSAPQPNVPVQEPPFAALTQAPKHSPPALS